MSDDEPLATVPPHRSSGTLKISDATIYIPPNREDEVYQKLRDALYDAEASVRIQLELVWARPTSLTVTTRQCRPLGTEDWEINLVGMLGQLTVVKTEEEP
jgi:hypothetical protein